MIAFIFVFIGLAALVKGKLKVTTTRELSAGGARTIGLGFLFIAYLLQVTAGASDQDLRASLRVTDVAEVRLLFIAFAIGAALILTVAAVMLAHDVKPDKGSKGRSGDRSRPTPAARSTRLCCWLLDCALVLAPALVVRGVATLMGRDTPADIERILPVIGLTSIAVYALQCWLTASSGQSLAKGWLGIRVVRPDGAPPGVLRGVVLRCWLPTAAAGLSLIWPLLGFVTLFNVLRIFGSESRCLHDLVADTIVVNVAERSSTTRIWSEA